MELENPEMIYEVLEEQTNTALNNVIELEDTDATFSQLKRNVIKF